MIYSEAGENTMGPTNKQVRIELHTTIDDNGQMEYNTIRQIGSFYKKKQMDVLTFEEKTEDNTTIRNFITIQPDKVTIKRSGDVVMNQQFRIESTTENVFRHPYGTMHMETFTETITHQSLEQKQPGHLKMAYTVKLNGEEKRRHLLTLTYNEE